MRKDGRRVRRLTPRGLDVAIDVVPDWSPDGAELTLSGKRGSRSGVWTIHADGRRLRFLARGADAAWSPSGDRIVFTALNGISVVSASGGRVRRLTHGPNDSTPAWSPDGRTVAFVRSDVNGVVQKLALVRAAGGPVRRIFGGRDAEIGRTPQWSPSGRLLAVSAHSGVYVIRVRDRAATRLRRRGDWPAWSPDGRRIAFTSGSSIFVMNANGSGVRRVRTENGSEFDDGPHWSPDGKALVYSTVLLQSDFEIFSVRPDGTDLRQLTHNTAQDWMPAWSPSRRRIAFVRGGWIWLMRADGTGARRLFQGGQPSWSPNGVELAYSSAGGVVVRRLDHGPATRVADGFSPAWSPNGAEIAFVNGTQLRAVARASGAERTIVDLASTCPVGNETPSTGRTGHRTADASPSSSCATTGVSARRRRTSSTRTAAVSAISQSRAWTRRVRPGRRTGPGSCSCRRIRHRASGRSRPTAPVASPSSTTTRVPPTSIRTGSTGSFGLPALEDWMRSL